MIYIPEEWMKDKKNEQKIHEIFNEHLYTDLNLDNNVELAIQKLNDIGETVVIEKIRDGTISIL
jgi:hypothetical protein